MSTLQTANIWFESTGNNRIQSSGSNGVTIFAGGSNVATVNTTAITVSNAYLMVGNSTVNTTVNATTVSVGGVAVNAASLNPYQGYKNRIINGDMRVDQRGKDGTTAATCNSSSRIFGPDRWAVQASSNGTRSFTMQQKSDTPPTGHSHYVRVSVAAAGTPISAEYNMLDQPIEGYMIGDLDFGKATAKTITVSAWVRSSLTGTFSGAVTNGDPLNRSYPFTFSIPSANTWTQISATISGDTTGTWPVNNTVGMYLMFDLGCGSNYRSTANAWGAAGFFGVTGSVNLVGTLSATFDITGVQLEIGSSATLFDRRPYGFELSLCQRYFEAFYSDGSAVNFLTMYYSTSSYWSYWQFKTEKRTNVTFTPLLSWTGTAPTVYPGKSSVGFYSSPSYGYLGGATNVLIATASAEL